MPAQLFSQHNGLEIERAFGHDAFALLQPVADFHVGIIFSPKGHHPLLVCAWLLFHEGHGFFVDVLNGILRHNQNFLLFGHGTHNRGPGEHPRTQAAIGIGNLHASRNGSGIRIDEIPQIFNVLKGDMSFIGPRPERPFFVESLSMEIPYYTERHQVKPGISGWAQLNYPYGASVADAREKLSYDLYYIKNYSIFLDLIVLMQTVRVVIWPQGVR